MFLSLCLCLYVYVCVFAGVLCFLGTCMRPSSRCTTNYKIVINTACYFHVRRQQMLSLAVSWEGLLHVRAREVSARRNELLPLPSRDLSWPSVETSFSGVISLLLRDVLPMSETNRVRFLAPHPYCWFCDVGNVAKEIDNVRFSIEFSCADRP